MEAAFIDIGTPKNAVLYHGDVRYDTDDVETGGGQPRIEQLLRPGQTILCQVTKNPIGAKGARLTQEVSLPGSLRGAGAQQHGLRDLQAAGGRRAQEAAQDRRRRAPGRARTDRADRGGRGQRRGAGPRRGAAGRAVGDHRRRRHQGPGPGPALPGAGHRRAGHPRGAQPRVPGRGHRRPGPLRAGARLRGSGQPGAGRPGGVLRPRRSSRCRSSSATTSTSSCTRRSTARSTCLRGAPWSSTAPRP